MKSRKRACYRSSIRCRRFEITQPGNVLRFFERGGRFRPEIGIPERLEESGKPRTRLGERGLGTETGPIP